MLKHACVLKSIVLQVINVDTFYDSIETAHYAICYSAMSATSIAFLVPSLLIGVSISF